MNKVTVNVKTLHGEVIKTYELEYSSELSLGDLYEEDKSFYTEPKSNKLPNIKRIENGGN